MTRFQAAIATSQGGRRYQEDAATFAISDADGWLIAVLADGMGGHAGGAVASKLVCDSFLRSLSTSSGNVEPRLVEALESANDAIARSVKADPALAGMGSTLIGTVFGDAGLEWVSVGDSPLYLYRRSEIALVNEDHSLAPALDELAASGQISFDAARSDPRRHMLRSAVTGDDLELVDLSRKALMLEPGDYVLLASDGIHTLDSREVARVVEGYAADGAQAVADALVRAVLDVRDAHQDNVTVVAIRVEHRAA